MAKRRARNNNRPPITFPSTTGVLLDNWWRDSRVCCELAKYYAQYMVSLMLIYQHENELKCAVYSGFLYRHRRVSLWVTAGHCFTDEIEKILEDKKVKNLRLHWMDFSANPNDPGIPVDKEHLKPIPINQDGVDLAAIIIPEYYRKLLEKNPDLTWFDEQSWYRLEDAKPDGFHLVGFPTRHVKLSHTPINRASVDATLDCKLSCLPVERISADPDGGDFWAAKGDAFYGRIVPYSDNPNFCADIKGMSGGPILSIQRDAKDRIRYYLWGIQSARAGKDTAKIRATSMRDFGEIIDYIFYQLRELLKSKLKTRKNHKPAQNSGTDYNAT